MQHTCTLDAQCSICGTVLYLRDVIFADVPNSIHIPFGENEYLLSASWNPKPPYLSKVQLALTQYRTWVPDGRGSCACLASYCGWIGLDVTPIYSQQPLVIEPLAKSKASATM